jgi:hypothetical protein
MHPGICGVSGVRLLERPIFPLDRSKAVSVFTKFELLL